MGRLNNNNILNMQVDESILSNPQFQQLATELTATNNPINPPTNTANTTNSPTDTNNTTISPTDKTNNTLINWRNDLTNSETTTTTEYNVDKNKVKEEMEDYRKRYLNPAANSVQDYVNRLRDIRKTYDITNVPQREQDQRLSGLLMLANAFGNLASVTGEAAGDSAGGNRGLVPVRTNDKFDNLYNQYLANKDAATQARALQIKRNMDDALEELKLRYDADKDYRDKEEREYQRLIDKYSNKKITKTGFNRVQIDPTSQEYKDHLEKKRLDEIKAYRSGRAYRSGGGRSKEKEEKTYSIPSPSYQRKNFSKNNGSNGAPNGPIEKILYNEDKIEGFSAEEIDDLYNQLFDYLDEDEQKAKTTKDKLDVISRMMYKIRRAEFPQGGEVLGILFDFI